MFNEIKDLELLLCIVHLKNILINQALSAQCESAARGFTLCLPWFSNAAFYRLKLRPLWLNATFSDIFHRKSRRYNNYSCLSRICLNYKPISTIKMLSKRLLRILRLLRTARHNHQLCQIKNISNGLAAAAIKQKYRWQTVSDFHRGRSTQIRAFPKAYCRGRW